MPTHRSKANPDARLDPLAWLSAAVEDQDAFAEWLATVASTGIADELPLIQTDEVAFQLQPYFDILLPESQSRFRRAVAAAFQIPRSHDSAATAIARLCLIASVTRSSIAVPVLLTRVRERTLPLDVPLGSDALLGDYVFATVQALLPQPGAERVLEDLYIQPYCLPFVRQIFLCLVKQVGHHFAPYIPYLFDHDNLSDAAAEEFAYQFVYIVPRPSVLYHYDQLSRNYRLRFKDWLERIEYYLLDDQSDDDLEFGPQSTSFEPEVALVPQSKP